MFSLVAMSTVGSVLLAVLAGWIVLHVGMKVLWCVGRFVPMTVLGVVAVIGGLALFGSRSDDGSRVVENLPPSTVRPVEMRVSPHNARTDEHDAPASSVAFDDDDNHTFTVHLGLSHIQRMAEAAMRARETYATHEQQTSSGMPRWMIVSLGTILIISGALLAGRERTRPVAVKALTALGIAAIAFSVVSFVGSAPRQAWNRDRIVKVESAQVAPVTSNTTVAASEEPQKPRRSPRAKRPLSRPARPGGEDFELPPRAGEIPVAVELAKSAVKPDEPATVPSAPGTNPAPAAAPAVATAESAATTIESSKSEAPAAQPATTAPAAATAPSPSADTSPVASAPHKPRPAWIDAPPKLVNAVYSMSIKSGLFVDVPECQRALDLELKRESDRYIDDYLGGHASSIVNIPLEYLKEHVKKAEFSELIESESVGPMQQIYARLEFDDSARADFHRLQHDALVSDRLWYAGSAAGLVLALLATFYGYLKVDLRTGGAHKGRLRLAATLMALIAVAGALVLLD
jgi:hypothetical protein